MKEIAVIHIGERDAEEIVSLLGEDVRVVYRGTAGDAEPDQAGGQEFPATVANRVDLQSLTNEVAI